jgi:hypothetical protein
MLIQVLDVYRLTSERVSEIPKEGLYSAENVHLK